MAQPDHGAAEVWLRRRGVTQAFSFGDSAVSVVTRDIFRRSIQWTADYSDLAKHPTTVRTGRSNWWLAAAVAFTVGASIQIFSGNYGVGNTIFSVLWCGAFYVWWWLGQESWRGYRPVMALDVGEATDEVLDSLHKRRVAYLVGRLAKQDPVAAARFVSELSDEGLIDEGFARDLLRPEAGDDYRPGTYL